MVGPIKAKAVKEPVSAVSPIIEIPLGPNLSKSRPLMGLMKIEATAPGIISIPVVKAENPFTLCQVNRQYDTPPTDRAELIMVTIVAEQAKTGVFKILSSSSGSSR